jgi:23S rRNA (adenine2503-C2)-methyltransferase
MSLINNLLCGLNADELTAWCEANAEPKFRSLQLLQWIYLKRISSFDKMSNLPAATRERLKRDFVLRSISITNSILSPDGTTKLLLQLPDSECIEMVIIPADDKRITFCLSTQVGCPVQCYFCASGANGLVRNLSAGEIVEQLLWGANTIDRLPDNIVFMGIGEGLLNFDNLSKAISLICGEMCLGVGARRITVSTSGYVPGIYRLADLGRQLNLAVSLHATSDKIRAKLIPDKFRFTINEIINACEYYMQKVGRMVTLEYTLLANINDSIADAEKLASIAKSIHAKINLIPYNQVTADFHRPAQNTIKAFYNTLKHNLDHVTLRQEKGSSSAAACGQLRITSKIFTNNNAEKNISS